MARQLTLIPAETAWQLDRETRETGRRGVAQARAILAAHPPSDPKRHKAA